MDRDDVADVRVRHRRVETCGEERLAEETVDEALGCIGVVTNYAVIDAASLAAIHGAGMRGLVYTVNDPAEARRLDALGIDGIVTDAVDRFSPGNGVAD